MALKQKIDDRSAVVGVIGLGYVGLPLIKVFFEAGFATLGFDVDPKKIEMLNQGQSYLEHLGKDFVVALAESDRFEPTADFARLAECDAILICVPTPLGKHLEPDLSYVEKTGVAIAEYLRPGQLIVLESTTYPGTTREILLPLFEARNMTCGEDFYLAYSPEREDPGRKDHTTQSIPKLVGGIDEASGDLAVHLYSQAMAKVVPCSKAEIAESAKLLENIYRAVNIAMVNEMKVLMQRMGIDIWEVIEAAGTKPFGFQAFYPGPGLGGHCIPIDPFYLTWKAREVGLPTRFIELSGEINHMMPEYVVQRAVRGMNDIGVAVRGARVLVLGLAYKPDVDDVRESPSFELIELLNDHGAKTDYHDPHVAETHHMRHYDLQMRSIDFSAEALADYDCVVIATHHAWYDWAMIGEHAKLIVDSRGVMRQIADPKAKIVYA